MRRIVLVAVLLAVAAAVLLYREQTLAYTNWQPVDVSLPLTPGRVGPIELTIDRDGVYEVGVEISRSEDASERFRNECLLGFDFGNPKWGMSASTTPPCTESPIVDLRWQLESLDGNPPRSVADEPSTGGRVTGLASGGSFGPTAFREFALGGVVSKWGRRVRADRRYHDRPNSALGGEPQNRGPDRGFYERKRDRLNVDGMGCVRRHGHHRCCIDCVGCCAATPPSAPATGQSRGLTTRLSRRTRDSRVPRLSAIVRPTFYSN